MRIASLDEETASASQALRDGRAYVKLTPWTIWRTTGADRASFFHSFCTADLKKRAPGEGSEAFVTTGQGKVFDFVFFTPLGETLWLDSFGDRHAAWDEHFDRYRFMEKAKWEDASGETLCLYLSSDEAFEALGLPRDDDGAHVYSARIAAFDDVEIVVRRVEWLGTVGWTLFVPQTVEIAVLDRLREAVFVEAPMSEWHRLRTLAGTPLAGVDLSEKNLPQEAGRTDLAISFTKGCYLGQETVARLDMMGHVNWKLALIEGPVPPGDPPADLTLAGKVAARLGTIVEGTDAATALAFVRRDKAHEGSEIETDAGTFRVKRVVDVSASGAAS